MATSVLFYKLTIGDVPLKDQGFSVEAEAILKRNQAVYDSVGWDEYGDTIDDILAHYNAHGKTIGHHELASALKDLMKHRLITFHLMDVGL